MNRRNAIKRTFCFSASLLAGRNLLAATSPVESSAKALHYLMIGDWGWSGDLKPQTAVARGMAAYTRSQKIRADALLLLGDNFYGPFKGGTDCPRWKSQFEDMYPAETFPGPCHAVLGNHDYDDEPVAKLAAELAYSKAHPGTRWNMPAKWFRLNLGPAEKPLVSLLALDSNYHNETASLTKIERKQQLEWLDAELGKPSPARWKVVMGHHPLYSDGVHGDDPALVKDWDGLFRKHKVHFYFCGHDHDLQHLELENHPTSFVISGGGGAELREPQHQRGPFSEAVYGFTHLEISAERFMVKHMDSSGKMLHSFVKHPDHSWSPT
jgi:tartrate-resistant acid phosphatase type 5